MAREIDCGTCRAAGPACHDCVVTFLLGPPPEAGFTAEEEAALDVLADSGLVPRLRMVQPMSAPAPPHPPGWEEAEAAGG